MGNCPGLGMGVPSKYFRWLTRLQDLHRFVYAPAICQFWQIPAVPATTFLQVDADKCLLTKRLEKHDNRAWLPLSTAPLVWAEKGSSGGNRELETRYRLVADSIDAALSPTPVG